MTTRPPDQQVGRERTALFRSRVFHEHDTGDHPENAGRLLAIDTALERLELLAGRPELPFNAAPDDILARVHDPRYIAGIREFSAQGGGWLDADTRVGARSVDIAALAAGAGVAAVDAALDGQAQRGFVLARPPGHHATPSRGMGFCLFNTIAVAAAHALARGLERVLIVDWDVHHGNGTQDAFFETDEVLFCSVHQWPLYPGTGATSERGAGRGTGYTINVPLAPGANDDAYLDILDQVILPAANTFRPQIVLISAGFDAHATDPLGGMLVTEQGFGSLARAVVEVAEKHADGRVVAFLEGGYDPQALAKSVVATLAELDGDDAPLADALRSSNGGTETRHDE
jgi:acetoin utilization deacetylase AcuC-like enzyme